MTDTTVAEAPRQKRKYTKRQQPQREAEIRTEPVREEIRETRQRVRKGFVGSTDIPLSLREKYGARGMDLQWVTVSVNGQPTPQVRAGYEVNGWQPLLGKDAPDIASLFMPKGWHGEIEVSGLVLMERPMELTLEARREEYAAAKQQLGAQVHKLQTGQIDGVSLDTQHPTARANTRLSREMLVPKD